MKRIKNSAASKIKPEILIMARCLRDAKLGQEMFLLKFGDKETVLGGKLTLAKTRKHAY